MVRRRSVLTGIAAFAGGCVGSQNDSETSPPPTGATVVSADSAVGYPHLRPSGNRVAAGRGALPDVEPVTVSLDSTPTWLAAVPTDGGSRWAIVDRSDTLSLLSIDGDTTIERRRDWPSERPPAIGENGVVTPPDGTSELAPPLVFDGGVGGVSPDGEFVVTTEGGTDSIAANLLPDARLCKLDRDRAVALGGPTNRYDHGVLGDSVEASEIVVLDRSEPSVERRSAIPDGWVVEGIAPIVTELGGDIAIVVTESNAADGARLAAYSADGSVLARGDPIGSGFRWRHQLAVAPFGPNGQVELAVVKTPHIGGTVEFYRRRGTNLEIATRVSGASSHAYGSRNLDGAVAADADGDGRMELVVPTDAKTELLGVGRTTDGATVKWSVPIGGRLSTNVVGVSHDNGLAVGVGHEGGQLRLWLPP